MPRIACEWGLAGVAAWRDTAAVMVIVDVLSFCTAVSVAVDGGAAVIPHPYGDPAGAAAEAARLGAVAALPRGAAGGQLSLSPASMRHLQAGARVLLPSPNGARLSLATGATPTLAGCLRNGRAVARAAGEIAGDGLIAVIPAGERWPDGALRPAIEDWLGAGAVVAAIAGEPDAEAALAAQSYSAVGDRLAELVRGSRSGLELAGSGYREDVEVALEVNSSSVAPVLRDGAYWAR